MKKFILLLIFILMLLVTASCMPRTIDQEKQSAPPWVTPSTSTPAPTSTSPPNATRTPLVIPERTPIPFRTVNQLSAHIVPLDSQFNNSVIYILTEPSDIAPIDGAITSDDRETLGEIDFGSTMGIAVYGESSRDLGKSLKIRMVYLDENTLQLYAVNHDEGFSFEAPAGESGSQSNMYPYNIITINTETLPNTFNLEVYRDSELTNEIQVTLRD